MSKLYSVQTWTDEEGREVQALTQATGQPPAEFNGSKIMNSDPAGATKFLAKAAVMRVTVLPQVGPTIFRDEIRVPIEGVANVAEAFEKHDAALAAFEEANKKLQQEARAKAQIIAPPAKRAADLIVPR